MWEESCTFSFRQRWEKAKTGDAALRIALSICETDNITVIIFCNYTVMVKRKSIDYTSIIAKAMIGHYDREKEAHLTHEELLAKIQEGIREETAEIKNCFPQTPYPMMYPYMPMAMPGMQAEAVKTGKTGQAGEQIKTPETEELNEAALDFMDSFMGG